MEQPILDSGLTTSEMVLDISCGQMVPDMKDNGKTTKQMAKASLSMPMEMFTKVIG
jgi:hypothetical protein